jgi:hypothetical protein
MISWPVVREIVIAKAKRVHPRLARQGAVSGHVFGDYLPRSLSQRKAQSNGKRITSVEDGSNVIFAAFLGHSEEGSTKLMGTAVE